MNQNIILASASPRRIELLEEAGIEFEAIESGFEEQYPDELTTDQIPVFLSRGKALTVAQDYPEDTILAADTVVVVGNKVLGKPKTKGEAIEMLSILSGRQHAVITGVTIYTPEKQISFAVTTKVWFRALEASEIEYYIDRYQPYDKAGAYGIQEWIGLIGILGIEGDYNNVVGLPVSTILQKTKEAEIDLL